MACVLVIDEYASFREAMEYCLPKFGYAGLSAGTFGEAATLAKDHRIDVVLLDIGLPSLSGLAACEAIRRDRQLAHAPVVILSGVITAGIVAEARAAGAVEVVSKPFQWPQLLGILDRLLPNRS